MTIDIGIEQKDRVEIAAGLSRLLADSYTLYLKTHNYHWNVTGPMFNTLHQMFEEQYTELAAAVDEIAERIRALGVVAPGSYSAFSALTEIPEDNESGPLILLAAQIKEFNPPTKRGKRTFDDAEFIESLTGQFKTKKSLTDRQRAALKRTLSKYASQITDYDKAMEEHGLPAPKVPKAPKAAAKSDD